MVEPYAEVEVGGADRGRPNRERECGAQKIGSTARAPVGSPGTAGTTTLAADGELPAEET